MNEKARSIRYFLFSQYLADGIRITLEIVLPSIICGYFGRIDLGITISLGALCVSISDTPGPVTHKRNAMLYCNIFIFLMALLTGIVNDNSILLGGLILFSAFFFSMFTVFGSRAASVGTAVLLVIILRMSKVVSLSQTMIDSSLILCGGIWYMLFALLFYRFTPYRPAQRAIGDCIHETAKFLRIKSALYNPQTNLEEEYRKLVEQQVVVNEKQDAVRELLYKNADLVKEPTHTGKLLVLTFVDVIDLYEQIMATWYDYSSLRKRFRTTGILEDVSSLIEKIADEIDNVGHAIQSNIPYKKQLDIINSLEELKMKIDELDDNGNSKFILKKVLVNLRNLNDNVNSIFSYFTHNVSQKRKIQDSNYYSKFVSHQPVNTTVFANNLTLKSSVFRHSLRMMITCGIGFLIGKLLPYGQHSYWILLTIIIILKPGFSLTKQRNFERLTGTIAGGLIGLLLLAFIHDRVVLFALIIFFMIGTYTFQRMNYIVMVIFVTPYILLLFNFLGMGFVQVAEERLLDTTIASVLAFLSSYLLFPNWESKQLNSYMAGVLMANINYLQMLTDFLCKKDFPTHYKLVRKEVFVNTANLSAAFQRMLSEPKSKQRHKKEIYKFVIFNHVLSSNIAGVIAGNTDNWQQEYSKEIIQILKRSKKNLEESLLTLDKNYLAQKNEIKPSEVVPIEKPDKQLLEQLEFIYKLTTDITNVTQLVA
jgi:uncharacterized membrane protein (TIGR01666 family)